MPSSNGSVGGKKKKPLRHTLLAGGTAGFVESSICHPLDTIKTRMQLRNNHIESMGTRLRHSLVEPAMLHVRHSLVEPAFRFKHSLAEPSTVTVATASTPKHSLVEPANLIKLRRQSLAEPALIPLSGTDASRSTTSTKRVGDVAGTKLSGNWWRGNDTVTSTSRKGISAGNSGTRKRGVDKKMKSSSPNFVSTGESSGAKCWWNQPQNKTVAAKTSSRSFHQTNQIVSNEAPSKHATNSIGRAKTMNSAAWWNWHKNSSTTLVGRGQTSKSAAWCQPMNGLNAKTNGDNHGRRSLGTFVRIGNMNASQKGPLGPIQTARKIIRKEGFQSLYKGLSAVYVGIIPKMAIRFVSFEHYKDVIRRHTLLGDKSTNFAAGLSSGLTEAILIVTPAEVCKIRMQSQRHSLLDPVEANKGKYGNVVQTAIIIVREEGFSALYKGVVPTMLRQGCNQAVNFTVYNLMKNYWLERHPGELQLSGTISMLIGGLSGAMGPIINNPLDVVKTRLQKQNTAKNVNGTPKYTGLVQACFKISKEEGAGALWKGITPRLMRIVPGQAITFTTYEAVCRWLS